MVKFAIGYQLQEEGEESFVNIAKDFKEKIDEVYFPWLDMPTCRASLTKRRGFVDWKGQKRLEEDLKTLKKMGIKLNLLLNANCYGKYSASQYLANRVSSIIEHLQEVVGLDSVTTTSLAIAHTVKENFKNIDLRASVNMRIGTVRAMAYLLDLFDSFYIQREYNRNLKRITELKNWADKNNKKIYLLANSGCLSFCSGQIFHDNLVAHENEIDEMKNIPDWTPHLCWNYYKNRENWVAFLQSTWIRPEDIHYYEDYSSVVKLATRMHSNPRMVIQSYTAEKYPGNLLDLLEPGFSPIFSPYIIDNSGFPKDWFQKTTECNKKCYDCNYCNSVLDKVLVNYVSTRI